MERLYVPRYEEVSAAFGRLAAVVRTRFRGEPEPFVEKRADDRDAVARWARAGSADLEGEAQLARQRLQGVDRRH